MAVKRLTNYEMYTQARAWAGAHRPLFERHASITYLLTHADAVVSGFQQRPTPPDPELRALRLRAGQLDPEHDDLLALGYEACLLMAHHARVRNTGAADAWADVARALWPEGRAHNAKTWAEEGAHAVATGAWLAGQPAARALLASGTLPGGDTVLNVVDAWVATGTELDEVEQQSRDRERAVGSIRLPYPAVRLNFIRLAAALRQTLAMDASVPAADKALLLDDLAQVEAAANKARTSPDPDADPTVAAPPAAPAASDA